MEGNPEFMEERTMDPFFYESAVTAEGKNFNMSMFYGKVVVVLNMGRKSKYVE